MSIEEIELIKLADTILIEKLRNKQIKTITTEDKYENRKLIQRTINYTYVDI